MIKSSVKSISKTEGWFLASRPKTLLAALVPVLVGSAIAVNESTFAPLAAFIALICAILLQVGSNFVNDLYDYLAGSDKPDRVGPKRVLASGIISVKEMKFGIFMVFLTSFILGMYLVYLGGWLILLIGVISILSAFAYTAGPFPLAYNGLGDIFVFLFFGLIGTVGTYYVQSGDISALSLWASIPVGALITNILVVNNYRDIEEDRSNGKYTLAVKYGKRFTRFQYIGFMIVSYLILFVVYYTFKQSIVVFLPLLSLPVALRLMWMIYRYKGKALNKTLELTAKLSALYGLLFAAGIVI
jgi:1,4-dihydroxy-2-naphthoate octaprenyltransferase